MKSAVFWDVMHVVWLQFTFRRNILPVSSGSKMEADCFSEMSVNFYQITWCHIPEDITCHWCLLLHPGPKFISKNSFCPL
jgi:hypothetical protein